MSNRIFQGLVHQMRDAVGRTLGVIDETGTIIACSDLSKQGEVFPSAVDVFADNEIHIINGYTFNNFGSRAQGDYAVFVEGEDEISSRFAAVCCVALDNLNLYYEEKYNRMAQDQKACEIARQTNSWQLWAQYYRDFGEQGSCAFEAKQQYQILKNQEEQNEKLNRQREEQQREYNRQQQAIQQQENNMAREREIIESRRASAGGSRYWSEKYRGTWAEAKRKCENLREGGYSDWRLPTISELRTLITYSACSRTYPGGECPITDSNPNYFSYKKGKCHCNGGKRNPLGDNERFWSSTGSNENGRFWYVFFGSGSIYADKNGDPYDSNYFRCTR